MIDLNKQEIRKQVINVFQEQLNNPIYIDPRYDVSKLLKSFRTSNNVISHNLTTTPAIFQNFDDDDLKKLIPAKNLQNLDKFKMLENIEVDNNLYADLSEFDNWLDRIGIMGQECKKRDYNLFVKFLNNEITNFKNNSSTLITNSNHFTKKFSIQSYKQNYAAIENAKCGPFSNFNLKPDTIWCNKIAYQDILMNYNDISHLHIQKIPDLLEFDKVGCWGLCDSRIGMATNYYIPTLESNNIIPKSNDKFHLMKYLNINESYKNCVKDYCVIARLETFELTVSNFSCASTFNIYYI